jgi:hypothetical protein
MSHEDDEQVWPERATEQAAQYFSAASKTLALFNLCVDSIIFNDFLSYTAKKALEEDDDLAAGKEIQEVPKITPEELAKSQPGPRTKALRKYRQEPLSFFSHGRLIALRLTWCP